MTASSLWKDVGLKKEAQEGSATLVNHLGVTPEYQVFEDNLRLLSGREQRLVFENLASLAKIRGDYGLAAQYLGKVLLSLGKVSQPDYAELARVLDDYASVRRADGYPAHAEGLYKSSLGMKEKALGEKHPEVAVSLNNLAALYESQGRFAEAEPLCKRALAILEKAWGNNHPLTIVVLENYGVLLHALGRNEEAEAIRARFAWHNSSA